MRQAVETWSAPGLRWYGVLFVLGGVLLGAGTALNPETAYGLTMGTLWTVIACAVLYRIASVSEGLSWNALRCGLGFRFAMAFMYIGIVSFYYAGAADFQAYQGVGTSFGEGVLSGELRWFNQIPKSLTILFGVFYFLVGSSLIAMFVVAVLLGFLGSYFVFRAFETAVPHEARDLRFLYAMLFTLPSFSLWTSVLGKESLMLFFVGLTMFSFAKLLKGREPRYWVWLLVGVGGAWAVRAAVGAIIIFGLVAALLFRRPESAGPSAYLRPVIIAMIPFVAGILFWQLALHSISERLGGFGEAYAREGAVFGALEYYQRGLASDSKAGSTTGIAMDDASLGGFIRYLPKGMFALLFRPFVFEARNLLSVAAALESMLLFAVFVWRIRRLGASVRGAFRDPFLAFCLISGLILAAVLSMGTNFGVMVRQRGMVLPFVFILLAFGRPGAPGAGGASDRGRLEA